MLEYLKGARHLFQREEQLSVGIRARGKAHVLNRRTAECWNTWMSQGICFKEKNSRVLEYVHEARNLFQREEQPSVGIRAWDKAFVSKRRTVECWNTCMGQGICFKEKNSRVLEYVHRTRHLFQREEQSSVGIRAWGKAFVSKRRTAECWNTCMGQGICFKGKNSRVLEYVHGIRHLFQREEQPSIGIHARGKAPVSKRRTAECWNTCMRQGICFKVKNIRVLDYVHEARHLFQREEQPSVGIHAGGKAFVSKRRTAECWNTCMGQGICFKEKNSRVLEYVHGERYLFQREEQPSVGIHAWGKAFVSKRRTAECWNTCRGQGICFKEKNSRVLEHMHGARHLFQREKQPSFGIHARGKAFVSKRRTAECWNTCMGQGNCFKEKNSLDLEYVHGTWHLFQIAEQQNVGIHA